MIHYASATNFNQALKAVNSTRQAVLLATPTVSREFKRTMRLLNISVIGTTMSTQIVI